MQHLLASLGLVALLAGTAAAQSVPTSIAFTARVSDGDAPATGPHDLELRLFAVPTGGVQVWNEVHAGVEVSEGLLYADLGGVTPLSGATFAGSAAYLEVIIDGQILSPRVQLRSVPYALRADTATSIAGEDRSWGDDGLRIGPSSLAATETIHTSRVDGHNSVSIETTGTSFGEAQLAFRTPVGAWGMFMDDVNGADIGPSDLGFYQGGATRVVFTGGGRVGIGTTTPTDPLEVAGAARIDGVRLFRKTGNNGSVSCDTFCQGSSWGDDVGACVAAKNHTDGVYVSCAVVPGFGHNLRCLCASMD